MASDLLGQRFSRLMVVDYVNHKRVLVRCDCGGEKFVHACSLRSGTTMSCGCLRQELAPTIARKHGRSRTKEHAAWKAMRSRCLSPRNKDFPRYGGRGITICQRWLDSFEAFLADMGPAGDHALSIDRRDVDGDYEPGNCRWATDLQQANNKTNSRRVVHEGREQTVAQWARELGLPYAVLHSRVHRGVTGARLFAPSSRC